MAKPIILDFLTGQLSPFGRVVIVLALLGVGGLNLATVVNPPDTAGRWYRWDELGYQNEHAAEHAAENAATHSRIHTIENTHAAHLQHSAKYTAIIERDDREIEKIRDALNRHLHEDH